MRIKPILFSGPMVRAILAGQKTQTRRVARTKGASVCDSAPWGDLNWDGEIAIDHSENFERGSVYLKVPDAGTECRHRVFPKYQPGDILWVRETWREFGGTDECGCGGDICHCAPEGTPIYRANQNDGESTWRPSIHMPKKHCRLFLKVKHIRVECIQNIGIVDSLAEGIPAQPVCPGLSVCGGPCDECKDEDELFMELWDSINAKRGFGWEENPIVWVYEFERTEKPEGWTNV